MRAAREFCSRGSRFAYSFLAPFERGSQGHEHLDLRMYSYPCARLRIWSRETVSAVPSRYCTDFIYTRNYSPLEGTRTDPVQTIDQCRTGPTEPPFDRNASRYAQCRVRKRSNECVSEKRLVKSQRLGVALTERGGSWGPRRFVHLPPSTACGRIFFGPELELYQIRSPSQFVRLHANTHRLFFRAGAGTMSNSLAFTFVRLHGKPYRLFFDRELNGLFALLRVSSNSFAFMRTHIDHFFRAGARTESHKGNICRLLFYLPPSIGLLLTVRSRFFSTHDRV